MPDGSRLKIEIEDSVAWLTISKPERRNALNRSTGGDLLRFFEERRRDQSVRVIVLKGDGEHFCSGADLRVASDQPGLIDDLKDGDWQLADAIRAMRACPQPVIAMVRGGAVGGGMALALGADFIIADDTAFFSTAFIKLGLTGAELGTSWYLQRLLGPARARRLIYTGARIDAAQALRDGLVAEVVAADQLLPTVQDITQQMLRASPHGLRLTKRSLDATLQAVSLDTAIVLEERAQQICFFQPEFAESTSRFLAGTK